MIQISSLSKTYGNSHVFEGLNLICQQGERIGLIGPNGSGKSTLLKIICGALQPTSGQIQVFGLIPEKSRFELVHQIGAVFGQMSIMDKQLSLKKNFLLHKTLFGLRKKIFQNSFDSLVDFFDLKELLNSLPHELSLGQKMRAEVALNLLHRPQLLILDEPTIGLDPPSKLRLRTFVRHISQEQNVSVILTSHDVADLEEVCDRLIVLHQKQFFFDGNFKLFKENFIQKKTLRIRIDQELDLSQFNQKNFDIQILSQFNYEISFDTSKTSLIQILKILSKKVDLLDLELQEPQLDELICKIYQNR